MVQEAPRPSRYLSLDYGDLKLPPCSEQETAVRNLRLDFEELSAREGLQENLRGLKGSAALSAIDAAAEDYAIGKAGMAGFGLSSGGLSTKLLQHIKHVIKDKDFRGVPDGSPEKFALRELAARANQLKFQLIEWWLDNAENTGLTQTAQTEYRCIMPAMAAVDRMYLKIATEDYPIDSNERRARGLTNECAIVRRVGDQVIEVPFGAAFPEEIDEIGIAYEDLIAKLKEIGGQNGAEADLTRRKIEYYELVAKAFKTSNREVWLQADTLLLGQIRDNSDLIHIHPIKTGYGKDRIVRLPEIGLRIPNNRYSEMQRLAGLTKGRMVAAFDNSPTFRDLPNVAGSVDLLKRSNTGVRHFLGSGLETMDLNPAGQMLPNETDQRFVGGVDSSLSPEGLIARLPARKEAFEKVFGQGSHARMVEPRQDIDHIMGYYIAAHELGHVVGLVSDLDKRLQGSTLMNPYIEEWKASAAGMLGNYFFPWLKEDDSEGSGVAGKDLEALIAQVVVDMCRYADQRNAPPAAAYVRHSMMFAKVAEEVDILKRDENGGEFPWKIDFGPFKAMDFLGKVIDQLKAVMKIYKDGSPEDLCDHLREALKPTPFINFVFEKTPVPDGENFTAEKLAQLPEVFAKKAPAPEAIADDTRAQAAAVTAGKTA